jgi:hypothetical protein
MTRGVLGVREVRGMREVRGVLGVLVLALVLEVLLPQSANAQTRDVRSTAGTAVITGIVVTDDADAKPVRKARVTCGTRDLPGHTTITDDAGRFVFAGLPAGRYTIAAAKPTWVTTAYGARRPMRAGTPVPLADGQKLDIVIRLAHGAVITGVLLDHNNQPAAGALVRAMRYQMNAGERRLVSAGDARTDDRGVYRIFGLAAGDYFVSASAPGVGAMSAGDLRLTSDANAAPGRSVTFAAVYFPGGTNVSQAGVVSLRPGEERDGVDFALQLVPTARIDGSVTLPEGGVPAATEIHLIAIGATAMPGMPFESYRTGRPGADGTFSFVGIPPGQYTLLARGSRPITNPDGSAAPPQLVWASTQIAVDGEPIGGLALSLEPALTIAGRVQFRESETKPPDLKTIRIAAQPVDTQTNVSIAPVPVTVGADGRFSISGVIPGRYRLTASFPGVGRPGAWSVESITANAQDALDAGLTVLPNQHVLDALVTFTDRLAQISGTVRTTGGSAADYTAVLFPADERLWIPQSRRIQSTRAGADGAYSFRGVPAGTYRLAVTDDVENGEWFDPAFLQRLAASALNVSIAASEQKTQDLTVAAIR